jgi:hypothetical protein
MISTLHKPNDHHQTVVGFGFFGAIMLFVDFIVNLNFVADILLQSKI